MVAPGALPVSMKTKSRNRNKLTGVEKCPTGIRGLDEVTEGGLPRGRPTLVCGSAGSGKTLLASEFIVRGARDFDEPGVFMAFEETENELVDKRRLARLRPAQSRAREESVSRSRPRRAQ